MPLSTTVGSPVNYVIDGHSTANGAAIPAGSTITLTSSNPAVAAAPTIDPLVADQKELVVPVVTLAEGATDFTGTVQLPGNGGSFAIAADTLTVAAAAAVLDHVTGTFVSG